MKALRWHRFVAACLLACAAPCALAVECIVPAKPGGGMDASCKLLRRVMQEQDGRDAQGNVKVAYLPGGIGAVAWGSVVSHRRGGPDSLVAFSGGSLLGLAQGKYGRADVGDVRLIEDLVVGELDDPNIFFGRHCHRRNRFGHGRKSLVNQGLRF